MLPSLKFYLDAVLFRRFNKTERIGRMLGVRLITGRDEELIFPRYARV